MSAHEQMVDARQRVHHDGQVDPVTWSVSAVNLPEHARNPIHTDAGAQSAGFPRALVAGVTTYAYLTHPLAAAWGVEWLGGGGAEVRFRSPVFEADPLECRPELTGAGECLVSALVDGHTRATVTASLRGSDPLVLADGEALRPLTVSMAGEWADYGLRAGDDLGLYAERDLVHPAVWPALANQVVHAQVARGSWVHTRSRISHHALVPTGSTVDVESVVVRRFTRPTGERAVLHVVVRHEGRPAASLEHEAIVALPA